MDKQIKKAIEIILKDIRKNAISKEHRKAEINPGCPECQFRILEGYLVWYRDLEKFSEKIKKNTKGYIEKKKKKGLYGIDWAKIK